MQDLIEMIKRLVRREAETRRDGAAFGGRWDDGGANRLLDQVKFYEYGQQGVVPSEWETYATTARNRADPEWVTYERLKRKFEK